MPAYLIAEVDELDPAGMKTYRRMARETLGTYGAKGVASSSRGLEVLEGDWAPKRLLLFEFESLERLHERYESDEYQVAKRIRQASARSNFVVLEGA